MNSEDRVKPGSKADIRKTIKAVRNAMDRGDCAWRSELICRRLSALPEYVNAINICAYISKGNEVDTRLIVERAWADGKHVYVPKVYGQDMEFIEITDYEELAGHRGLYAAGEYVDVTGKCGGYNIMWAVISGMRAGESAGKRIKDDQN